MSRLKILLVEDNPLQALRTSALLERSGLTVVTAAEGSAALTSMRGDRPDVILADVLMPVMDGFQLCREIRLDPALRSIPIVLQSASFQSEEDRQFALKAGADEYVEKGIPVALLVAVLSEVGNRKPSAAAPNGSELGERNFRSEYGERLVSRLVSEAAQLERANEALTAAYDATIDALVGALDVRDTETELHSWRVTEYAYALAVALGINGDQLTDLERGSMLHDIGKIGIPDQILRKPSPLTEQEWDVMRTHPGLGYEMVADIEFLRGAATIVQSHHERWDGGGYPAGRQGVLIPMGARIFAVADTIDAITSDRPYRAAQDFGVALEEIRSMSGKQFDPEIVEIALSFSRERWEGLRDQACARQRPSKRAGSEAAASHSTPREIGSVS